MELTRVAARACAGAGQALGQPPVPFCAVSFSPSKAGVTFTAEMKLVFDEELRNWNEEARVAEPDSLLRPLDGLTRARREARMRIAKRLATLSDLPSTLTRLLLRDELEVARPLLTECTHLSDADLVDCVAQAGPDHRRLAAARRGGVWLRPDVPARWARAHLWRDVIGRKARPARRWLTRAVASRAGVSGSGESVSGVVRHCCEGSHIR